MELATEGYRLHAISPLFIFIEAVKKSVFPLLFGYIGTKGDLQDLIFIGIVVLASVATIVQFWFYHYWLEGDRLVVKEGIFFKSLRQVPYERIQNLNVEKNILHRWFKVATLQVESASGVKPEAVIRVISDAQVVHIQSVIKAKSEQLKTATEPAADNVGQVENELPPLYQMSNQDVTTFGFISHRALIPIGIVGSVLSQNDNYRDRFIATVQKVVGELHVERWDFSEWLIFGGAFVLLMLVTIWLSSIALAFLKLYQFKLSKIGRNLHAEMGLLTKITANIPVRRIQLLKVKHTPLHRWFKKVSIKMETAGGVTEQSGISMKWIAPLVGRPEGEKLLKSVQPEVDWQAIKWLSLEAKGWRRMFKKLLFFVLVSMVPLLYFFAAYGLLPLLLVPGCFWYAKAYIRHAGYAINDQIIAYRHGVFFHSIGVVKIGKIQNISYLQTPFDRRHNMARLSVDTAGSGPISTSINLHYLGVDTINAVMQKLSREVSQTQFIW